MENTTLLKLTHLKTGNPTFIKVEAITSVRETDEGKTLILTGTSGQYVKESVDRVLTTLSTYGFDIVA